MVDILGKNPGELSTDELGRSALQVYSAKEHKDIQDFLLDNFPNIATHRSKYGNHALFEASNNDNRYLVHRILEIAPEMLWVVGDFDMMPIEYVLRYGIDIGVLEEMISFADSYDLLAKLEAVPCESLEKKALLLDSLQRLHDRREGV
ncbi:hypothetical protein ATCVMN08101_065L [Acanthocystis turfacea Chlorella virus MN0810.1]|nr:hypothetical protein ATCVMN08101_065L [Acanthocystis turfacea Chlorella virus MN0810.1]